MGAKNIGAANEQIRKTQTAYRHASAERLAYWLAGRKMLDVAHDGQEVRVWRGTEQSLLVEVYASASWLEQDGKLQSGLRVLRRDLKNLVTRGVFTVDRELEHNGSLVQLTIRLVCE